MINIEAFPAGGGDCFLLDLGETLILIDCGFASTYQDHLRARLTGLAKQGRAIDRLIITHIDSDHIGGAIRFLEENGASQRPQIIRIEQVWHNSYRHIQFEEEQPGHVRPDSVRLLRSLQPPSALEIEGERPVSGKQGTSLGALLLKGGYSWNSDFSNAAVTADSGKTIDLGNGAEIRLLSPYTEDLHALRKKWRRELYKLGFRDQIATGQLFDDAFEFLLLKEKYPPPGRVKPIGATDISIEQLAEASFAEDTSATNRSSLSFILSYQSKNLLFLADSFPSVVERSLRRCTVDGESKLHFDFIKISHHGSEGNMSPALLALIDAPLYCIPTDGSTKHGHPSAKTLARIVSRPANHERRLIFNYCIDAVRRFNALELRERYKYSLCFPDEEGQPITIEV